MYPAGELTKLAARKDLLRRRIALRRVATIVVAQRIVRPLRLVDRIVGEWRRLSPLVKLAGIPLGALLGRSLHRRRRLIGKLIRWGPVLASVWRGFAAARKESDARRRATV